MSGHCVPVIIRVFSSTNALIDCAFAIANRHEYMKTTQKVAILLLSLVAATGSAVAFSQAPTTPVVKKNSATYRCDSSPSGECAFLLYSSTCTDGPLKNGHPVLLCTHEFFSEFSLKVGESRVLENLPPIIKQCSAPPNSKPKFPDCVRER